MFLEEHKLQKSIREYVFFSLSNTMFSSAVSPQNVQRSPCLEYAYTDFAKKKQILANNYNQGRIPLTHLIQQVLSDHLQLQYHFVQFALAFLDRRRRAASGRGNGRRRRRRRTSHNGQGIGCKAAECIAGSRHRWLGGGGRGPG